MDILVIGNKMEVPLGDGSTEAGYTDNGGGMEGPHEDRGVCMDSGRGSGLSVDTDAVKYSSAFLGVSNLRLSLVVTLERQAFPGNMYK